MPESFYAKPSLHVEIYDILTGADWTEAGGDVYFLRERFRNITGPVLELGCGSARAAIPLTEAGFVVHGIDASSAMLSVARAKQQRLPASVARRLFLTQGDMRGFEFTIQFGGVYSTFRSARFRICFLQKIRRAVFAAFTVTCGLVAFWCSICLTRCTICFFPASTQDLSHRAS